MREDKILNCQFCPFVTEYKHHLEYHLRNHMGSKPFKCSQCNYRCVNKSMLNSHMKSHTNVYPFRCQDCGYATKYCHSLKQHLDKLGHMPSTVLNSDGSLPQGLDNNVSRLRFAKGRRVKIACRAPTLRKPDRRQYMQGGFFPMGMPPQVMNGTVLPPYWHLMNQMPPNGFHPGVPRPPPPLIPVSGVHSGDPHQQSPQQQQHHHQQQQQPSQLQQQQPPPPPQHQQQSQPPSQQQQQPQQQPIPPPPPPPHQQQQHPPQDVTVSTSVTSAINSSPYKCTFCSVTAENMESLNNHLLKVHAAENQDLFNAFGISSEALLEDHNLRTSMISNTFNHSDGSEQKRNDPSDSLYGNTDSNFQRSSNGSPPFNEMKSDVKAENINQKATMSSHPIIQSSGSSSPQASTIKQMMNRFGMGPLPTSQAGPEVPQTTEIPLDLRKPKSPIMTSPFMGTGHDFDMRNASMPGSNVQPTNVLTSPITSIHSSALTNMKRVPYQEAMTKKRSRKSRAFKRDTFRIKYEDHIPMADGDDELSRGNKSSSVSPDVPQECMETQASECAPESGAYSIFPGDKRKTPTEDYPTGSFRSTPSNEKSPQGTDDHVISYEQLHKSLQILNEELEHKPDVSGHNANNPINDNMTAPVPPPPPQQQPQPQPPPPQPPQPSTSAAVTSENMSGDLLPEQMNHFLNTYYSQQNSLSGMHRRGSKIAMQIIQETGGSHHQTNNQPPPQTPMLPPQQNGAGLPFRRYPMNPNDGGASSNNNSNPKVDRKNKEQENEETFECGHCGIVYRSCIMYTIHMGYHCQQDPLKCNMCGHQSRDKIDFFIHIARAPHV